MSDREKRSLVAVVIVVLIALGIGWAGNTGDFEAYGLPVYYVCILVAFVLQWLIFIPSYANRTEKYYDLAGGITYLAVVAVAIHFSDTLDARSWLLAGMVAVWAIRLSGFLYLRIHRAGEDRRFREMKQSFARFLLAWTLQALWVVFSLAAALAAITSANRVEMGIIGWVGVAIWVFGMGFEVIADRQKSAFRADEANKGKFIRTGLWAWSRHPNYFGEIVLWVGVAVVAIPVLQGAQWITLISPVFVYLLLTRISGLPMLEASADERWGGQREYEAYKANTPVLWPKPPKQ